MDVVGELEEVDVLVPLRAKSTGRVPDHIVQFTVNDLGGGVRLGMGGGGQCEAGAEEASEGVPESGGKPGVSVREEFLGNAPPTGEDVLAEEVRSLLCSDGVVSDGDENARSTGLVDDCDATSVLD